jgi:hypothetical protein
VTIWRELSTLGQHRGAIGRRSTKGFPQLALLPNRREHSRVEEQTFGHLGDNGTAFGRELRRCLDAKRRTLHVLPAIPDPPHRADLDLSDVAAISPAS